MSPIVITIQVGTATATVRRATADGDPVVMATLTTDRPLSIAESRDMAEALRLASIVAEAAKDHR
jgi:hypothetical protein